MATHNPSGDHHHHHPPCDYCNHHAAVIFCRADSAKLCLLCDHHVHAANALSGKHLRSQICDTCRSAPVSTRCATDNLVLCRDCDWDAHGSCAVSAAHDRTPVDGFTGTPSPLDLASIWGFTDFIQKSKQPDNFLPDPGSFRPDPVSWMNDTIVPDENDAKLSKLSKFNIRKHKNVILKQLIELFKSFDYSNGGSDETRQQEEDDDVADDDVADDDVAGNEHQPFTSLLMMQGGINVDFLKDRNLETNMLWDSKPRDHRGTQVKIYNIKIVDFYKNVVFFCGI